MDDDDDGPTLDRTTKISLLVATALTLMVSTGARPIPLAAWITGVFALRFARASSPVAGYFALAGVTAPVAAWSWSLFPFGGPVGLIILAVIVGLSSALPVLFDRLVSTHLRGFARTLPFPIAATALDFLLGSSPDFGSWGATGYSQLDSLAMMQSVSVVGLLGLTFLTAWLAAAINSVWEAPREFTRGWRPALPAFVGVALVLVAGQVRLAYAPVADGLVQVSAIGGPRVNVFPDAASSERWSAGGPALTDAEVDALRSHNAEDNAAILHEAERLASAGSRLITWGEGALVVVDRDFEQTKAELAELARRHQVALVAAMIVLPTGEGERRWDNQALLFSADGELEWSYRKAIPTPGRERDISLRGTGELLVSEVEGARVGALICYDLDFPDLVAQAHAAELDILVGPAGDWPEVAPIHAKMARARAIEQGITLVRPTSGGVSVAYDGLGRVLAKTHSIDNHVRSLTTWAPTEHRWALAALLAGPFGWLSVIAALALVGMRIAFGVRDKREKNKNETSRSINAESSA